jgi:hypothetical protein
MTARPPSLDGEALAVGHDQKHQQGVDSDCAHDKRRDGFRRYSEDVAINLEHKVMHLSGVHENAEAHVVVG